MFPPYKEFFIFASFRARTKCHQRYKNEFIQVRIASAYNGGDLTFLKYRIIFSLVKASYNSFNGDVKAT